MGNAPLIVSVMLLGLPSALSADDLAATKKQLAEDYVRIAKMRKAKDVQGLTQFLKTGTTLDFKEHLRNGRDLELKTVLANLPQQVLMPGTIRSFAYKMQSVRRIRNAAIAHVVTAYSGTNVVHGKAHRFAGTETWDDVWTKNYKGIWLLKYVTQGPSTFTLDGKPIPH